MYLTHIKWLNIYEYKPSWLEEHVKNCSGFILFSIYLN